MKKVVSVVFEGNHKKYYFESIPNLKLNNLVVVETIRGVEIGKIVEEEKQIDDSEVVGELRPVIRLTTEDDLKRAKDNKALRPETLKRIKEIVKDFKLDMKVLDLEYTLDKTKLIIYFTADERIDFRELVKVLASEYKTRIELRQIGPRDASRIVGGIGPCGRKLCCHTFLGDIQNVSIKMAKNQNLSLNPTTISGLCGKLLCCISFEDTVYSRIKESMPDVGDTIGTEKGDAKVESINILDETVSVTYPDGSKDIISMEELTEE